MTPNESLRIVVLQALVVMASVLPTPSAASADCTPEFVSQWFLGGDPGGIDTDNSGNVYATEAYGNRVDVFTSGGTLIRQWGATGNQPGMFQYPKGIAVTASGEVFVADWGNNRIQKFTISGVFLQTWGLTGSGPGQFRQIENVALAPDGRIFAADGVNRRIQVFDATGAYLYEWGEQGNGAGQFGYVHWVAVHPGGFVYVVDGSNHRIQKFTLDGTWLASWGSEGSAFGQFSYPDHVEIDPLGNVAVTDWGNQRIQLFDLWGNYLTSWGSWGSGPGQFYDVRDTAFDPLTGEYLVGDRSPRIQRFRTPPSGPCPPGPPSLGPKILLHVAAPTSKNACAAGSLSDCRNAVVTAGLSSSTGPFYYVYLLAAKKSAPSVAGIQCGLTYERGRIQDQSNGRGVDIFSWTLCASLEFSGSSWPAPGGTNLITWDPVNNCQTAAVAVAGYFYVAAYSMDVLRLVPHSGAGNAKLADCSAREILLHPLDLGFATFSPNASVPGCNPCITGNCEAPTPVVPTTWSAIKSHFMGASEN